MQQDYTIDREEEQSRRRRFAILAILAAVLIAVLSIGGTLAYLTATTNTKNNVFTSTTNITATLTEPGWDGGGSTTATNMLPGTAAAKDPKITNTSAAESEYVAERMTFQKAVKAADGTYTYTNMTTEEVNNLLVGVAVYTGSTLPTTGGITVNSNWTASSANAATKAQKMYYYNSALAAAASTPALFDNVAIIAGAGNTTWNTGDTVTTANFMSWLSKTCADGKFQLTMDGCAVQVSNNGTAASADGAGQFSALLPVA